MNLNILVSRGKTMKIQKIKVKDIGGIRNLELSFNENFNVICGANGIGKTTILKILTDGFVYNSKLKKNALCEDFGSAIVNYSHEGNDDTIEISIKALSPREFDHPGGNTNSKFILPFDIGRQFDYIQLDALTADPSRRPEGNCQIAASGISAMDLKNWFVNRFAFHDKDESLTSEELFNYKQAKEMFGILDKSIQFKTVSAKTFDIMLKTPNGDIYFEYLSSGYKSCIYVILGIIKEIEYRFSESPIKFLDFDGCILIDEFEEHLHPSWQAKLVNALKQIFPKAQFIITTHSPSILQCVENDEIIALTLDESHNVCVKELHLGEYGLQGWTLEEILTDVMEMPSTTSEAYEKALLDFSNAIYEENPSEISRSFKILDKMLHPNSTLRHLLKIQMAGLGE